MITRNQKLKYQEIAGEIEAYLVEMTPGAKLPSDRELARNFGCTTLTVRKAFEPFVSSGKIVRKIGSGTFKCEPHKQPERISPSCSKLGMLIYFRSDEYAMQVIKQSLKIADQKSLNLRFSYISDYNESALKETDNMVKEGCSALIIPWFPVEKTGDVAKFVHACPLPVAIPMLIPGLEQNCFEKPEVFGSGTIIQTNAYCNYFYLLGHRHIALLGPNNPADFIMQQRLSSYSNFIYRNKLDNLCGLVGNNVEEMDELASQWKAHKGKLPVICHDDLYATRFMTAMRKLGLSAPDDYCIVGYNNSQETAYTDPPLSSMHDDYTYFGKWLIKCALALAKGKTDQSSHPAKHYLVVRDSCGGKNKLTPEILGKLNEIGVEIE